MQDEGEGQREAAGHGQRATSVDHRSGGRDGDGGGQAPVAAGPAVGGVVRNRRGTTIPPPLIIPLLVLINHANGARVAVSVVPFVFTGSTAQRKER